MFVRTRFQYGSLRLRKRERGSDVWEFRYYETNPEGKRIRQSVILGEQALYRTEDDARKATQALLMRLNDEAPREEMAAPTFGALLDRYIEHELPERHSTRSSHLSNIRKHIRPRWGEQPVNKLKPMAMEQWLRDLPLAPKSKVHIRSLMHLVLKCAERWGVIEIGKNPVTLVRVKNASKRLKRPQILEVGQFFEMLKHLAEPYRTMVMVAQCTGLRISEILGLQWVTSILKITLFWFSAAQSVDGSTRRRRNTPRITFRSTHVLKNCCFGGGASALFPRMGIGSSPIRRQGSLTTRRASRSANFAGWPSSSAFLTG